jgi:dTDP-4-dehydrorhamnose 3,5-epimerase
VSSLNITNLPLKDAALIEVNLNEDSRGIFARFFCNRELEHLLDGSQIVNINYSQSKLKGTLRGFHFQNEPHREKKFVRCISGGIYDVVVDLRPDSNTFLKWYGVELTESNKKMLYIPEGFAHGYQTLENNSEILYCVTNHYSPSNEAGLRYNDPSLKIDWPLDVTEISEKDMNFPNFI